MGVCTALILLYRGFDVDLISKDLPQKQTIKNGKDNGLTSQIAAGYFLPIFYDKEGTKQNARMIRESWEVVKQLHREK